LTAFANTKKLLKEGSRKVEDPNRGDQDRFNRKKTAGEKKRGRRNEGGTTDEGLLSSLRTEAFLLKGEKQAKKDANRTTARNQQKKETR